MNAKQPVNNSRNNTSDGAKQKTPTASAKSVRKSAGAKQKSKAPSPPPQTGVLVKRSF